MARAVIWISDRLDRLCRYGAAACIVAMLAAVSLQVAARYLFNQPPSWTEELTRFAMVWGGMLGATIAFKTRFDPTLVTLPPGLSAAIRLAAAIVGSAAVLIFLLPVLYYSLFGPDWSFARGFLARTMGRVAEAMGFSMVFVAVAVPFAIVVILVHLAARLAGEPAPDGAGPGGEPTT